MIAMRQASHAVEFWRWIAMVLGAMAVALVLTVQSSGAALV